MSGLPLFLQRDPAGYIDGLNLYAYAGNNPLAARDPYGLATAPYGAHISNYVFAQIAAERARRARDSFYRHLKIDYNTDPDFRSSVDAMVADNPEVNLNWWEAAHMQRLFGGLPRMDTHGDEANWTRQRWAVDAVVYGHIAPGMADEIAQAQAAGHEYRNSADYTPNIDLPANAQWQYRNDYDYLILPNGQEVRRHNREPDYYTVDGRRYQSYYDDEGSVSRLYPMTNQDFPDFISGSARHEIPAHVSPMDWIALRSGSAVYDDFIHNRDEAYKTQRNIMIASVAFTIATAGTGAYLAAAKYSATTVAVATASVAAAGAATTTAMAGGDTSDILQNAAIAGAVAYASSAAASSAAAGSNNVYVQYIGPAVAAAAATKLQGGDWSDAAQSAGQSLAASALSDPRVQNYVGGNADAYAAAQRAIGFVSAVSAGNTQNFTLTFMAAALGSAIGAALKPAQTPAEQAAAKQQGTSAGNGEVKPSQSAHRLTLAPPRSELEYGLQFDTSGLGDHPPLLSSHADLSPSFGLSPYRPGSAPGLQWNPQATPSKASAGPSFDAKMNISFKVSGVSPAASQGDVLDFGGSSISGTNIASIHMQFNDQVVSAQFGSSGTTTWQCQDKEQIYTRVAISGAGAVGAMVVIGGGGKLLVAASPYIYLYGGSAAIVAQNLNYRLAAWQPLANTVDKFILYYPNSPPLRRDVAGLAFGMLDFADGLLSPNPPPPTLWGMTGHVARKGVDQVNDYLVQELGL